MKQLFSLVVILVATTGGVHAQSADTTTAPKVNLARRLYDEGVDASGKGQWNLAYDRFKTSYELAPRVLTLFNLAYAQGQTGQVVEATENYRKFLRDTGDGRYPDLRTDATNQLELLGKQIAQLTLDITHLEPSDVIAIDEVEFPQAALHEAIPMNPGPHVVLVRRGTVVIATRAVTLASGESNLTHIELRVAMPGPAHRGASSAWLQSPWLWFAVAILGAATASGVYRFTRSPAP